VGEYNLVCLHPGCGVSCEDTDFRLHCHEESHGRHGPALLRPVYQSKKLSVRTDLPGIFPFHDWLPTGSLILDPLGQELGRPACYKSMGLAKWLGLQHLYIAFSGYWPEIGANLATRTFKEFEAQGTYARYYRTSRRKDPRPFIIASAGNTANGFNLLAALLEVPLYLVVPETGLENLVLPYPTDPFLILVSGDYSDAVSLADVLAREAGLTREGGVRNVARRAAMGTVMLNGVAHPKHGTGFLFDHYLQAVGSGTGAIAAWEAAMLLLEDGRFGNTRTHIHVAQNAPFTPIVDSWRKGSRKLVEFGDSVQEKIDAVTAQVLTNRYPPYEIHGGLFDVLSDSRGYAWSVQNRQLFQAARVFREKEGIDIGPPAAVAVDALRQAVQEGAVAAADTVMLHITGGGREHQLGRTKGYHVKPAIRLSPHDVEKALQFIAESAVASSIPGCIKVLGS
jgi:cysteate synthase